MRRAAVVLSAVVLFGGLSASPASAQTDAVSVARALINAENAHDVATAVSYFAPGAIVNLPTGSFTTRAEIEQWQRELAAGNFHADITPPVAVTPEVVTFSGTVALDLFRGLGIGSLESTWQLTIQLGRITTFNFGFTPAAGARLGAALAGAGAGAASSGGGAAASGGSGTSATAGRTLALTGANVDPVAPAVGAILVGVLLLAVSRKRRSTTEV